MGDVPPPAEPILLGAPCEPLGARDVGTSVGSLNFFQAAAVLISITALFSYLNFRFIRLPTTIGVMLIALVGSVVLVALGHIGLGQELRGEARHLLNRLDFDQALLQGMLSFMLFAGALQINLSELAEQKVVVAVLATVGVLLSTFIVGTVLYFALSILGFGPSYAYSLLFGALISPTDPIAVLGILRTAHVPKAIETRIAGESLFNDGVGVVVFLAVSQFALGGEGVTARGIGELFLVEAGGGVVFGLAMGWATYRLLRSVDNYQVEVLLTLALVTGGYALASELHLSGPIAIVVAGLVIGNHGRRFAMSERTREHLDMFWELLDEIFNAVLFVLIGFEVLALAFSARLLLAGIVAVPVVLLARWLSVALPAVTLRRIAGCSRGELAVMTWCGLRGGISVALALSLPPSAHRDAVIGVTYVVVVCSIIGQGLTVQPVVRRWFGAREGALSLRSATQVR